MNYSTKPKIVGLWNPEGSSSCFLNVIIQLFWHVKRFRNEVLSTNELGTHDLDSNLKILFQEMHNTNDQSISSLTFRNSLTRSCDDQYKEGNTADCVEVFEQILWKLNELCPKFDIVEKIFALYSFEESVCDCLFFYQSNPNKSFVFRLYMAEFRQEYFEKKLSFETIISIICDENIPACGNKTHNRKLLRTLLYLPEIFSVSLIWQTNPDISLIQSFVNIIKKNIYLNLIFDLPNSCEYILIGIICYFNGHYLAYYCNEDDYDIWTLFDDTNIRIIGNLEQLLKNIRSSQHRPILLLYNLKSNKQSLFKQEPNDMKYLRRDWLLLSCGHCKICYRFLGNVKLSVHYADFHSPQNILRYSNLSLIPRPQLSLFEMHKKKQEYEKLKFSK